MSFMKNVLTYAEIHDRHTFSRFDSQSHDHTVVT